MQTMYSIIDGRVRRLRLPDPDEFVLPGIAWGKFDELYTPAYWRSQAWQHHQLGTYSNTKLGRTLAEEVAACLLGGYGMPAELGLLAFERLRSLGLLSGASESEVIERALLQPFQIGCAARHYRFPRQKARYLSDCLRALDSIDEPKDDSHFRDTLASLPGIGLKTASWIVRNYRQSNKVAIVDVHILRAGRYLGLYQAEWSPQKHYRKLEELFLEFAQAIKTATGMLDALMWDHMRRAPVSRSPRPSAQYRLL